MHRFGLALLALPLWGATQCLEPCPYAWAGFSSSVDNGLFLRIISEARIGTQPADFTFARTFETQFVVLGGTGSGTLRGLGRSIANRAENLVATSTISGIPINVDYLRPTPIALGFTFGEPFTIRATGSSFGSGTSMNASSTTWATFDSIYDSEGNPVQASVSPIYQSEVHNPEPGTIALAAIGLVILAFSKRGRGIWSRKSP